MEKDFKNISLCHQKHSAATAAPAAPRKTVSSKARICPIAHALSEGKESVFASQKRHKPNKDNRDSDSNNHATKTTMTRIPFANVLNDDLKDKDDDLFAHSRHQVASGDNDPTLPHQGKCTSQSQSDFTTKSQEFLVSNKEPPDVVAAASRVVAHDAPSIAVARKTATGKDVTAKNNKKGPPPPSPLEYTDADMQKVARFVIPHRTHFQTALREIAQGAKKSHYIWYLLPTPPYMVHGVERGSVMNRRFALRSDAQVVAYLHWDRAGVNLRQNYVDFLRQILRQLQAGKTMRQLLGMDSIKAISSIRLFTRVADRVHDLQLAALCQEVLQLAQAAE